MIRNCLQHGKVYHFERGDRGFRCGKCASKWVTDSRRNKKARLVYLFGGKCKLCGYKKYAGALDFHHLDRSKRSFSISVKGLSYSWDTVLKEAKKCMLLCKNCHTEVGNGIIRL